MKKNEIDMCSGPLLGKMITFAVPLMLTMVLQQLFNTADLVVVGEFGHKGALAAVGATGSVVSLFVNFFGGLSLGAGICMARYYGQKNEKEASDCVHTSILLSLIVGVFGAALSMAFVRPLLEIMATPEEVIDQSEIYMLIYFAGMPFMLLFNFCAAMLRSVGDSKRSLYYISSAGVINIILNLIFVIVFDLNVAGVAIATVISQIFSAALCVRCFLKYDGFLHLDLKKLRIDKKQLKEIVAMGLPGGIQGSLFSISNMLIQSSINSFGLAVMSGSTAAANIEGYIYLILNSIASTATTFAGQNFGALKFKRIYKVMFISFAMQLICGLVLGVFVNLLPNELLGLYTKIPEEIAAGKIRMMFICLPYFFCGFMDTCSGIIKGICHPIASMIVSLMGACVFRIVWIFTIFKAYRSLEVLFVSYPISWATTLAVHMIMLVYFMRKDEKKYSAEIRAADEITVR